MENPIVLSGNRVVILRCGAGIFDNVHREEALGSFFLHRGVARGWGGFVEFRRLWGSENDIFTRRCGHRYRSIGTDSFSSTNTTTASNGSMGDCLLELLHTTARVHGDSSRGFSIKLAGTETTLESGGRGRHQRRVVKVRCCRCSVIFPVHGIHTHLNIPSCDRTIVITGSADVTRWGGADADSAMHSATRTATPTATTNSCSSRRSSRRRFPLLFALTTLLGG
mmetsp:Transcript_27643/g.46390  ORF Transcript_27643/g.46390 Transcript_27643/m.46390 type:complete len:224 (-) Transcript_27643:443-1114(-)